MKRSELAAAQEAMRLRQKLGRQEVRVRILGERPGMSNECRTGTGHSLQCPKMDCKCACHEEDQ